MPFREEFHDILPLIKKPILLVEYAKSGCLPPVLHINNISLLMYPDEKNFQEAFKILLKTSIRDQEINVLTIEEWSKLTIEFEQSRQPEKYRSPRPPGQLPALTGVATGYQDSDLLPMNENVDSRKRKMFVVHKDEMRRWLKQKKKWPLDKENLLSRWWPPVESAGIVDRKRSVKKVVIASEKNELNNIFKREGQMWTLCYKGEVKYF